MTPSKAQFVRILVPTSFADTICYSFTMNTILVTPSEDWPITYKNESKLIRNTLGALLEDIQHIGSTSIPIRAKPIIDIAVLVASSEVADSCVESLKTIGYLFDKEKSSTERHLFRKGEPVRFHLSLAYKNNGSFWERQVVFRDYLKNHPDKAKEYEILKDELLILDPTGTGNYITDKSKFVQDVLRIAQSHKP